MSHAHEHHDRGSHGDSGAEVVMDGAFWDERYRSSPALWSGKPNAHLVGEVAELEPGVALDAGCGEGADAIWLAERGWHVTAVDISAVALERAAARAMEIGEDVAGRISWVHANLIDWLPEAESYDLVSAQFIHLPPGQREQLYRRLAESVRPGGTLLVAGHHPSDMETTIPRPRARELYFTASDIAELLDPHSWDIIVNAARERRATDPEGNSVPIHDAVLRAQRRLESAPR